MGSPHWLLIWGGRENRSFPLQSQRGLVCISSITPNVSSAYLRYLGSTLLESLSYSWKRAFFWLPNRSAHFPLVSRGLVHIASILLPLYLYTAEPTTHSWNWKPHPYTLPKRSVGVGSHFMVMSALYRYHADSHSWSPHSVSPPLAMTIFVWHSMIYTTPNDCLIWKLYMYIPTITLLIVSHRLVQL